MQPVIQLQYVQKNYYLGKVAIEVLKGISLLIDRAEYVARWGRPVPARVH
jgi:ABC-type lipoprotein export system ATPase subunit